MSTLQLETWPGRRALKCRPSGTTRASACCPAPRTESNRRRYDDQAVKRLKFIRHARELGFEVDAIRELLDLADQPQRPCAEADAIAWAHLADINSKIARLELLRTEVKRMLGECARGRIRECRVIEVLASTKNASASILPLAGSGRKPGDCPGSRSANTYERLDAPHRSGAKPPFPAAVKRHAPS